MADKKKIKFKLNGTWMDVDTDLDRMLLDLLRDDLGRTGTKKGCEMGECGACTVMMNGRAVLSCLTPALKADGAEIVTVEGLADGDHLHPLQEAFWEEGAVQCGYCTPGMLVSAKALLDENKSPTQHEVKQAISGNLCRCTGYAKIARAIQTASKRLQEKDERDG
jgi:carbon-monoxide dehydrogenase small subunit